MVALKRIQGAHAHMQRAAGVPPCSMVTDLLPRAAGAWPSRLLTSCGELCSAISTGYEQTSTGQEGWDHQAHAPVLSASALKSPDTFCSREQHNRKCYGEGLPEISVSAAQQPPGSDKTGVLNTQHVMQICDLTSLTEQGMPQGSRYWSSKVKCLYGTASGLSRQQSRCQGALVQPGIQRSTIAVGISGGIDSAVAAMLLKEQGHDIFGVFMRNWDESEERGNENCSVEADLAQAQSVCRHIGISLHEVSFVRQYWTQVFSDFLAQCEAGVTPNPDLACNRHIKFGALLDHCKGLGADMVATGHYARTAICGQSGHLQLLRGVDPLKDQSYFLASVHGESLADVVFPLGGLRKEQVRRLAEERGIPSASRPSSAGICFIGRRDFGDFISDYMAPVAGRYVDVDTGSDLGPCVNLLAVTLGQGSRISGRSTRMYVAGKDMQQRIVYVAAGQDHPALFTPTAALQEAHWIAGQAPEEMSRTGSMACSFKARYRQVPELCLVSVPGHGEHSGSPSAFNRLDTEWSAPGLTVAFEAPARAITPQQAFVMYSGDVCLGCAPVLYPGQSLHEVFRTSQ